MCGGRLFHRRAWNALSLTVDRWVCRTSRDVDEAERSHHLHSVSVEECVVVDVHCWWLNDRPTDSFVRPFVHPSFVIFWVFFISFLAVMWPWKVKVVTRIHLKLNISKKQFQLMCQWNTYRKTHTASWMVRWAWKIKVMTHNSWGLISWQQYKVQQWDRYRVLQNVFLFPSVVSVRYGWRLQRPARRCNIFPVRIHLLPPAQSVAFHEVFSGHHHLILTVSWLFA